MKPAKKAGIGKRRNFPSTTTEDGGDSNGAGIIAKAVSQGYRCGLQI